MNLRERLNLNKRQSETLKAIASGEPAKPLWARNAWQIGRVRFNSPTLDALARRGLILKVPGARGAFPYRPTVLGEAVARLR